MFKVLIATALPSDQRISTDLYYEEIKKEFLNFENILGIETVNISVNIPDSPSNNYFFKFLRYLYYPAILNTKIKKQTENFIVHITDHDYSYLCNENFPFVITCHDLAEFKITSLSNLQLRRWKWRINGMKKAKKVIADSYNTAKDIKKFLNIDDSKIEVNYLGVDSSFRPLNPDYKKSRKLSDLNNLKKSSILLLHVGSNIYRKNMPLLLSAISILKKKNVPILLIKVGESLYEKENASLIDKLDIKDKIVNLEAVTSDELVEIYNSCDIFLFPSLYEGFGRPIVEAQACGLPCIVANSSCLPEIASDGAIYHDPNNPEELADCVTKILNDPILKESLIKQGMINAKKYSLRAHVLKLIRIYESVLNI